MLKLHRDNAAHALRMTHGRNDMEVFLDSSRLCAHVSPPGMHACLRHLADHLRMAAKRYDVVVLQEVWVGCDVDLLLASAKEDGLEHAVHFRYGQYEDELRGGEKSLCDTTLVRPSVAISDKSNLCPASRWQRFDSFLDHTLGRTYHHHPHRRSGIFGSGLVTLSRWPILESSFHQYSSQGDPLGV